jgi:hypothetical protein
VSARIERVGFLDEAVLAESDLLAADSSESRLRGLHVRAAHATWGIAAGFEVQVQGAEVLVAAGLAYDCAGRELLLTGDRGISFDEDAADALDLVASYGEGAGGDTARLRWVKAGEVRGGHDITLARLRPDGKLDLSRRRELRRMAPARIATGRPDWSELAGLLQPFRRTLTVPTAHAGFQTTPVYFARLVLDDTATDAAVAGFANVYAGPFVRVEQPQPESFVAVITFPRISGFLMMSLTAIYAFEWVGVEFREPPPGVVKMRPPAGLPFEEAAP